MLGKLIKYEIRATSRTFLPMYALLIVFAIINKIFISINSKLLSIPQVIAMTVFIVIIAAIYVMTLVVTIQRFNKNLLTDEGYLSFTLPVKIHTHIDCKMVVSLLWTIVSLLVSALAIFVLAADHITFAKIGEAFGVIGNAMNQYGISSYVILFEAVVLLVIGALSSIVEIYAAITIGNFSSKHKLLAGVGAFVAIGIVEQIVSSAILTGFGGGIMHYFQSLEHSSISAQIAAVQLVFLGLIIYSLFFGLICYFLTEWLLRKKLNLE